MSIQWAQMMDEFHRMGDFDQLRAISKEQMIWLTEVAQTVPLKKALDLGFGCGFSAVAMVRGGCEVTCINNEAPSVPRRIEASSALRESVAGRRRSLPHRPTEPCPGYATKGGSSG